MITVYYFALHPSLTLSSHDPQEVFIEDPVSVNKEYALLSKNNKNATGLERCPAFRNYFNNTFSIKSPYDYSFEVDSNGYVSTKDYDQDFFDRVFNIRSSDQKLVSIKMTSLNIIPDKSVEMSQLHPSFGIGDISRKSNIVPGVFNPYLHPRSLESAFWLNEGSYNINTGDDLFYIKFNTNEKIKFQRIFYNEEIMKLIESFYLQKEYTKSVWSLNKWYNYRQKSKITSRILDIIKDKKLDIKD